MSEATHGVEGGLHLGERGELLAVRGALEPAMLRRLADRLLVLVSAQRRLGEVEGFGASRHGVFTFERRTLAWAQHPVEGIVVAVGASGASPGLVLSHATRFAHEDAP